MYAIVETSGKQYRVAAGETILVDRVTADVGAEITLDKVLVLGDERGAKIGTPHVAGAKVTAKVVEHLLGDKRITFKYMRTRRFRRKVGYRPSHTKLQIVAVG